MADPLPMAQYQSVPMSQPNMEPLIQGAQGFSQGIQNGMNIGIQAAQFKQQIALAAQQQKFEQGTSIAQNALHAYDTYGDVVGPESLNAFQKGMNMAAPGSIDPNLKWDPAMGGALKTASDAFDAAQKGERPWPEAIGVISKAMGQVGKVQRAKMEPMLQGAQDIFNQGQTTARQQSSQSQDTQRAYAEHSQPLIQAGATLNTIDNLLSKKDAASDVLAKANIEKLVANGSISQTEIDKLTASGGPFEKLKQGWDTMFHGTLDDYHRNALKNWIPSKVAELNSTLSSSATAFPGAKPATVYPPMHKTLKSGRGAVSYDGGRNWQPE